MMSLDTDMASGETICTSVFQITRIPAKSIIKEIGPTEVIPELDT